MGDYDYSNYDYSNHVENFSTFRDSVNQVPDMKNQEIGEVLLAFVNPILMGASKTALSKWAAKRKNNRAFRKKQNERGEPEEEEEDAPEAGEEAGVEAPISQTFENPAYDVADEGDIIGVQPIDLDPVPMTEYGYDLGEEGGIIPTEQELTGLGEGGEVGGVVVPEAAFGESQLARDTLADAIGGGRGGGGLSEPPPMPDLDAATDTMATQEATASAGEAVAAGGEAAAAATAAGGEAAGEVLATTATLALDTSWMPEVSTVIAVGGLVAASVMGFIDLFKHPSEKKIHQPAPLQTLPQLGI